MKPLEHLTVAIAVPPVERSTSAYSCVSGATQFETRAAVPERSDVRLSAKSGELMPECALPRRTAMTSQAAFGPNLRRLRLKRGLSLEDLSRATKVSVELWEAMERNDFSRWPTGVAARAYVRDYANAIGEDPVETIAEFCRVVPNGDRRAEPQLRRAAALMRHDFAWTEDLSASPEGDRRSIPAAEPLVKRWNFRPVAAAADFLAVLTLGGMTAAGLQLPFGGTVAVIAVVYHAVSMGVVGCSPAAWMIDLYFSSRGATVVARVAAAAADAAAAGVDRRRSSSYPR